MVKYHLITTLKYMQEKLPDNRFNSIRRSAGIKNYIRSQKMNRGKQSICDQDKLDRLETQGKLF